jgi:hypothetical protein
VDGVGLPQQPPGSACCGLALHTCTAPAPTRPLPNPLQVPEQLAVKSIVNTALTVQPASPHNAFYVGGCYAGRPAADDGHPGSPHTLCTAALTPAPGLGPLSCRGLPPPPAVSTAGERVDGFSSKRIRSERLVVYHYVTKSLQASRQARWKGAAGDHRRPCQRPATLSAGAADQPLGASGL